MTRHGVRNAIVLLALAGAHTAPRAAGAQNAAVPALLSRCASVPDEQACRSVLQHPSLSAAQRSLALTYLAEIEGFGDSLLREAIRHDPSNALAHYQLGARYAGSPDAIRHFRTALSLRPDWTHIHRRIADSYRGFDVRRDTAAQLWRAAAAADPRSVDVLAPLSLALLNAGELAAAESTLRRADSLEANVPEIVRGLCETLLRQKRFDAAADPCARTIAGWDGSHGGDLRSVSWWAEEAKQYDLALAAALQGLLEDPTSLYFRNDRTRILYQMNRRAEADSLLLKYVADHPRDWSAIEEAAQLMAAGDSVQLAYELYRRLLVRKCGFADVVCSAKGAFAVTALRTDRVDEAFMWLDSALVHQSDCPDVVRDFRRYASARRDSAIVLARLTRALEDFGAYVTAKGDAGQAADFFATIERWDRAAEFYGIALDSAVARERRNVPGRFASGLRWHYGHALVETGRYCEGLQVLTAAQREDPVYMNGRPFLSGALERARQRCRPQ